MSDTTTRQVADGMAGLRALAGTTLGPGPWFAIDQERVTAFADATLDHQWIHIDPERARKESPFGGPIAHGYLTLSLLPYLLDQLLEVTGVRMAVNYGLDRLRYPNAVAVGGRVRLTVEVPTVEDIKGGVQCAMHCTIEVEGAAKPALAAQVLFRYYE